MDCVYIIEEELHDKHGNVENQIVCAALNEEEAKHKVKYLEENVTVPGWGSVYYSYKPLTLATTGSWLVELKDQWKK